MPNDSIAFDRAADYYDETRGFPPGKEKNVAALLSHAGGLTASSRVLEIGVGTGRIALPLARHVHAVFGVDLSRPMLERLRSKQTAERVYVAQGDATRLPFAPGTFDAVVAVHVFHLIPDWIGVVAELERVLNSGAPLLHGWSEDEHNALWDAWNKAVPERAMRLAQIRREHEAFLLERGWRVSGEEHIHYYTAKLAPHTFVERLQRRVWSGTWSISDEDLANTIAAIEATLAEQFDDRTQPIAIEASFHVRVYWPPA